MQYLVSFLVLQSSRRGRERWFLKNCFLCHGTVSAMCLFLAVQWVGLQCVIVVFPGHILPTFFSCDFEQLKYKKSTVTVSNISRALLLASRINV